MLIPNQRLVRTEGRGQRLLSASRGLRQRDNDFQPSLGYIGESLP